MFLFVHLREVQLDIQVGSGFIGVCAVRQGEIIRFKEVKIGLDTLRYNDRRYDSYLSGDRNWETQMINIPVYHMGNDGKYVKVDKKWEVPTANPYGYNWFCTGDELTGYTIYFIRENVKIKHYAIELGDKMTITPGFDPDNVTFSIMMNNGHKITQPISFDPKTGIFDMGYYSAELTITSVDINLNNGSKLTYIRTNYYPDVSQAIIEYRVDTYADDVGGQEEDPTDIPEIPITGDNTNLPLLAGMLVLSLGALVVLLRRRKVM